MKLSSFLLICFVWSLTCPLSYAQENAQRSLLDLPPEILTLIPSFSDADTNLALRQTCLLTKACVDEFYNSSIRKNINTFEDTVGAGFWSLPIEYRERLVKYNTTILLEKDGYFFFPQASCLEGYITKKYTSISLYPYLKEDKDWAQELYSTLFDKQMPQKNLELALHHLLACLPLNQIYGASKESDSAVIVQTFKAAHHEALIRALKRLKAEHSYFLVGIDEDFERLVTKPHLIVVKQSHADEFNHLSNQGYLPYNHPHTIVYNIDQNFAFFPYDNLNIGKLILTNTNNTCTSIRNFFLCGYAGLTSLDTRGLSKVTSIGSSFLEGCDNLISLDTRGLSNVTSIGDFFLMSCPHLVSLDTRGLSNLTSIGHSFLEGCDSLTYVNTHGLSPTVLTLLASKMKHGRFFLLEQ